MPGRKGSQPPPYKVCWNYRHPQTPRKLVQGEHLGAPFPMSKERAMRVRDQLNAVFGDKSHWIAPVDAKQETPPRDE